ncbi:MAG: FAD-binding oxidoreductase [Holophagales bacterium]|nr:FAD-binding oxidoreductase [Holophagales bacterium]
MRRWNGWGDDTVSVALPARAVQALSAWVGAGTPPRDATPAEALTAVSPSRLETKDLLSLDPWERLLHARGQSLPDWIALRSGQVGAVPDAVAFPATGDDVAALLAWARERDARLIPWGGGTSVAGHVNPQPSDAPVVTVDLSRLSRLHSFDETSRLATFGAGVKGPDLEATLRARGFTLGHFPQSFELSTLGGWIATRSSGQQSLGYGRIERLFAGGRVETPAGRLDLPPFPASAAGPDLRELVLGSEGRLGLITEGTVRVSPVPAVEEVHGVFLSDFPSAIAAVRDLAAMRLPLSMLRLSTPEETRTTLLLAGHERLVRALETYLSLRGAREEKCLLLVGISGGENLVRQTRRQALGALAMRGGVAAGKAFGREWHKNRFRAPYLRNALWEAGWAVDTLETAAPWSRVPALLASVETALRTGLEGEAERVHAFTHLSHVYLDGSSLYTTYLFRLGADPDVNLARWRKLKTAASDAIVAGGGTISHQHGVGTDHAPWLAAEKGELGIRALRGLFRTFDPDGLLNPGKLVA